MARFLHVTRKINSQPSSDQQLFTLFVKVYEFFTCLLDQEYFSAVMLILIWTDFLVMFGRLLLLRIKRMNRQYSFLEAFLRNYFCGSAIIT